MIHLFIAIVFSLNFSCPNEVYKIQNYENIRTEIETNIDTSKFVKIAAESILRSLKDSHIRRSEFDSNGDYYIEFHSDTSNTKQDEIIWEYYIIEKDKLITGNLNSDNKLDFAIRSTWGPTVGNMFGLEWHIHVSENENWIQIENNFGGGKFSDLETLVSIDNNLAKTKFQELNEENLRLNDSVVIREYELQNNKLKRKQ